MPSFGLPSARAEASRRNGAKSCGPKTPDGKARSAQNALKHGLCAPKFVVVGDEDPQEFAALEAALIEELAPDGPLQSVLAARVARAVWRLERAERIEAGLFGHCLRGERNLGLALIRDGNGPRAFDTLLRYRGTTLAELWRALRLLKGLQAEAADRVPAAHDREPDLLPGQTGTGEVVAPARLASPEKPRVHCRQPIEPEARTNPCETASVPTAGEVMATVVASTLPEAPPVRCQKPIEPEARENPGKIAPASAAHAGSGRPHEERSAQATQKCITMRHSCAVHASPGSSSRSEAGAGGRT
jgi:hypothetical protein